MDFREKFLGFLDIQEIDFLGPSGSEFIELTLEGDGLPAFHGEFALESLKRHGIRATGAGGFDDSLLQGFEFQECLPTGIESGIFLDARAFSGDPDFEFMGGFEALEDFIDAGTGDAGVRGGGKQEGEKADEEGGAEHGAMLYVGPCAVECPEQESPRMGDFGSVCFQEWQDRGVTVGTRKWTRTGW